ncbi:TolC family protein [Mucilaginibacter corticis]|nr:TolC family protein [Mucilaginibacter corticis]
MKIAQLKSSGMPGVGYLRPLFFGSITSPVRIFVLALVMFSTTIKAQTPLTLKQAIKTALDNYGIIKAKQAYVKASTASVVQAKLDYLPNFNLSAQADYGTANGINGPAYGFGPAGISSGGIPLASQNWNAAFGSLYLANINWDFYAFGRSKQKILTAGAKQDLDASDVSQEIFQHEVRVAAAYLNLLAAHRLTASYHKNLDRADTLRQVIVRKAKKDLIAGVDSSQANAEVSNSKSILLNAMTYEDDQNSALVKLLGTEPQKIEPDTVFIANLPKTLPLTYDSLAANHPVLSFYKNRILYSNDQAKYYKTLALPTFTLGAAMQTRGSGFNYTYSAAHPNYDSGLSSGLSPDRTNYVVALGVTWNITQPLRTKQQVKSQRFISEGLKDELALTKQQLITQNNFADTKLKNAIADYYETPQQVKAANDTYHQKLVLYNHGLTDLVNVTQALYALVRAETDRDIAYNNVWQALLLKAAATGDFNIFSSNL